MPRHYLFADESGNFDFSRRRGATSHFAVGTLHVVGDGAVAALRADLLRLQTELGWRRVTRAAGFHASEDSQAVRDEVFHVLARHPFHLDVTLLEKSKAQPHLHRDAAMFAFAWSRHAEGVAPAVAAGDPDELMVAAAAVGTRRLRATFRGAVEVAVHKAVPRGNPAVMFLPSDADPALQAADYALWALVRSVTRDDDRALAALGDRVRLVVDLFAGSGVHHY